MAPGRIVVSDGSKLIQPLEASVVKAIHVQDGDHVKAGQLFIELDATLAEADRHRVIQARGSAISEPLRTAALLTALERGGEPRLQADAELPPADVPAAQAQLASEWADIQAKLARLQAEAARHKAEALTVDQQVDKLEATVQAPLVVVPERAEVTAEVTLENKDIGFVKEGQHAEIKLETFPYTRYGTVSATVDSVAADAVINENARHAQLSGRDANYQDNNAIKNTLANAGASFPATLQLQQRDINIDGKRLRLMPGMNVTAEIKTGTRRVLDYLLSPVREHLSDSMKER